MKRIQKLDSSFSNFSDRKFLSDCYKLIKLTSLTANDSLWIALRCSNIESIDIHGFKNGRKLSDNDFVKLLNNSTSLINLFVEYTKNFSFNVLSKISLNSLQHLELSNVGGELTEFFLSKQLDVCPNMKSVALEICNVQLNVQSVVQVWSNFPTFESLYVTTDDEDGEELVLLEMDRETSDNDNRFYSLESEGTIPYFRAFEIDTFDSLYIGSIGFEIDENIVDLIVEKCPHLLSVTVNWYTSCKSGIKMFIHRLLTLSPSIKEFTLSSFILDGDSDNLFGEKLPGNLHSLRFDMCFDISVTSLIHILTLNTNLKVLKLSKKMKLINGTQQQLSSYVESCVLRGRDLKVNFVKSNIAHINTLFKYMYGDANDA